MLSTGFQAFEYGHWVSVVISSLNYLKFKPSKHESGRFQIIKVKFFRVVNQTHLKTYFCIFEVKGKAFEGIIIRNSNMRAGGCKLDSWTQFFSIE